MSATVRDIYALLQEIAPFETAEAFDNVGLIIGRGDRTVNRILITLDVTMNVVKEAISLGADLIISHHPLLFRARKNLVEEDPEGQILCEMVRHHLSLISAHTNLDRTNMSGSACCARLLGLTNIRQESDYLFLGDFEKPVTVKELRGVISAALSADARSYGDDNALVSTLAIAGGAYDEGWLPALQAGAQALLTGEVRHHNALSAAMSGFVLFDGGHHGTEAPLVPNLGKYLQKRLNDVQYNVLVYSSQCAPF